MNTDSEDRVMIAELERIIQAEEAKPKAERDQNLIDDCVKEIAEIKGVKAEFSEEEVAQITDSLIRTAEKAKTRKRFTRLVAGIAAAIVLVTGVTACAVNPALINWIVRIVRLPFSTVFEQNTVTYYYQGLSEKYNSVEVLLKSKELDVYYPALLPDGTSLQYVETLDDNNTKVICFKFDSEHFRYTIQLDTKSQEWNQEIISVIETDDLHFDIYKKGESYISYSYINGNGYIIQSDNLNDLILVIGGLRKGFQ